MESELEKRITIQYNLRGEAIYVDIDGKRVTTETYNLRENPPPGILKGTIPLGEISVFELPGGKLFYCPKIRCHYI